MQALEIESVIQFTVDHVQVRGGSIYLARALDHPLSAEGESLNAALRNFEAAAQLFYLAQGRLDMPMLVEYSMPQRSCA